MPRYQLLRWEPETSSWTTVSTILANSTNFPNIYGSTSGYTILGDRCDLAIDTDGTFHILGSVYCTDGEKIVYGRSTDGTSWSFTVIDSTGSGYVGSLYGARLELDQSQQPHVIYHYYDSAITATSRPYRLRHKYYNGSSWSSPETIAEQLGTTNEIVRNFDFAIDSAGKIHVAFSAENGSKNNLYHLTNASGSWATTELATGTSTVAASLLTSIVVDAGDKVHIVRYDDNYSIYYHTNKSGSWSSARINGDLQGAIDTRALTINGNGDLLLLYHHKSSLAGTGDVRYAVLFAGGSTWQTGSVFSGNSRTAGYFSSAFTDDRVAMFSFDHYSGSNPSPNASNPRELDYATATITLPVPVVGSPTSASVTTTTAVLGGNVTSDGGSSVTARGVVAAPTATNSSPELNGTGVVSFATTGTTGAFTVNASGLTLGTAYSYRAYATNANGTGYSSVGTFTTLADSTPPTVESIVRLTPASQTTNASSVTFRVTYSEAVTNVSTANFATEPIGVSSVTGTVSSVAGTGSTRDVTVNVTGGSGEFTLKVIN